MINVMVLYPSKEGSKFDMDYYRAKHIPMVKKLLGAALKSVSVEEGVGGGAPGSKPTYMAVGHLRFDSTEGFGAAFGPHAATIQKDVPNYSNVEPVIQINEIRMT